MEGLRILRKNGWEFNDSTAPYPSLIAGVNLIKLPEFICIREPKCWSKFQGVLKTRLHHAFYLLSGALSYVVIITCQIRVIRFMRSMGVPTHCATRRAHTEINRALVALVSLRTQLPSSFLIEVGLGLSDCRELDHRSRAPPKLFSTAFCNSLSLIGTQNMRRRYS